MSTPAAIMRTAAAFLNDQNRQTFTDANQLEYFNQSLKDLEKEYELNDIPVTHETSEVLAVAAGAPNTVKKIGITGTNPTYPADLINIKEIYESQSGQNVWTKMSQRDFLPQNLLSSGTQIPQFLIWAWINDEIHLINANQNNDIKLDYVKKLFIAVPLSSIDINLGVKFDKCYSYLAFRTAAHSALYIGENPERAQQLYGEANGAMMKDLGIAVKGQQAITTRRLPFRFGYKFRGYRVG